MTARLHAAALTCLLLAATGAAAAPGDLHPTQLPTGLVAPADTVTLRWAEPVTAQLEVGFSAVEWTDTLTLVDGEPGRLRCCPEAAGLGAGVWTARLRQAGTDATSLPFLLCVEAEVAPAMTSPANGATVPGGTSLLAWEPVLGVPYYHVALSDREIVIEEDADGNSVIAGASIIWQAITPQTAIAYGAPDPSGFFTDLNGDPPPLVAGLEYNWIVLNNFASNPALTSTVQAGVSHFAVAAGGLPAPVLTAPADGDTLDAPALVFRWEAAAGADRYHFTLHRLIQEDENEGAVGAYDQVTSQTRLELPAASLIIDACYEWKVFALDASGQGSASPARSFVYQVPMGSLDIRTRSAGDAALPWVDVALRPLAGGGGALPIVTGSGGACNQDLAPGTYRLTASKDGFEPDSLDVTVCADQTAVATLVLSESPALLAGSVRDEQLRPRPFARVRALALPGGALRETEAGANGEFQLGLAAGDWRLWAQGDGYHAADSLDVSLFPGAFLALVSPLTLLSNGCTLSGAVLTDAGQPVVAAAVTAARAGESVQALTGNEGCFQLSLDHGAWQLQVAKAGYVPPVPRDVDLAPGEDRSLDPPLFLGVQAAIVGGFVTCPGGIVPGASVTATPETGLARTATSGPQGDFQFSLPPGTWTLRAARAGYAAGAPVQITVAAGGGQEGLALPLTPTPCSVSGHVMDGAAPLSGATVASGGCATLSAWDGGYTLSLPAGAHQLQAWQEGYSGGGPVALDLAPGQSLSGIDLVLGPDAATVSGRVLAAAEPVAGARVLAAAGGDTLLRWSDGQGAYSISLSAGAFMLWAEKEGLAAGEPLELTLGPGQVLPQQALLLTPAGATLSGAVRAGGAPLSGALVTATGPGGGAATLTGPAGAWTLRLPGGAAWTLRASRDGHAAAEAVTPTLADGESWQRDFDLASLPAILSGVVRDDAGQPVPCASLAFDGPLAVAVAGDAAGAYTVSLAPGDYAVALTAAGYALLDDAVSVAAGGQTRDFTLAARFARVDGAVRDATGLPLAGALLTASGPGAGSAVTDAAGLYSLPRLPAGGYQLTAALPGHASQTASLTLAECEAATRDFTLSALTGILSGTVRNPAGQGLADASLVLRESGAVLAQARSAADGTFALAGLPEGTPLTLAASLAGHAPASANPLADVTAPAAGLDFVLAANTGVITGAVTDAASGAPLAGADVVADDGAGFLGASVSGADGSFALAGLRVAGSYTVTADAPGWAAASACGIAPGGAAVVLTLAPTPATIFGTLTADREPLAMPAESHLKAVPVGAGAAAGTVALDSLGAFTLTGLRPGDYVLRFQVDGHQTEPRHLALTVAEGGSYGPFDFALLAAPPQRVDVVGAGDLDNDGSALYHGAVATAAGEQVDYPLRWELSPAAAGILDASTGRFTPSGDYVGAATLRARHAGSGLTGAMIVQVYARLEPGAARGLADDAGLRLDVPSGAVDRTFRVTVKRHAPAPLKRRAGDFRVEGMVFDLLPDGLAFAAAAPPVLTLPVPNPVFNRRLALGWWDPEALAWEHLDADRGALGLTRPLAHFSEYALLVANEPLAIAHAAVTPNPFSPLAASRGTEVVFRVESQEMAAPPVDVEIFNLLGDPVRTLARRQPVPAGVETRLRWDGLTDAGELARNGRYLVRITVHDNSGEESKILQAVLIK
ncbi:MAG: carboxypeptidase regulatory-like domain-containing protein [Candidatus Krumholzibacteriota bacterium]|nr:carboxypeptidase regulatory-like domain-containing protein [Candidatus Krumholzibacteriota bacterium]